MKRKIIVILVLVIVITNTIFATGTSIASNGTQVKGNGTTTQSKYEREQQQKKGSAIRSNDSAKKKAEAFKKTYQKTEVKYQSKNGNKSYGKNSPVLSSYQIEQAEKEYNGVINHKTESYNLMVSLGELGEAAKIGIELSTLKKNRDKIVEIGTKTVGKASKSEKKELEKIVNECTETYNNLYKIGKINSNGNYKNGENIEQFNYKDVLTSVGINAINATPIPEYCVGAKELKKEIDKFEQKMQLFENMREVVINSDDMNIMLKNLYLDIDSGRKMAYEFSDIGIPLLITEATFDKYRMNADALTKWSTEKQRELHEKATIINQTNNEQEKEDLKLCEEILTANELVNGENLFLASLIILNKERDEYVKEGPRKKDDYDNAVKESKEAEEKYNNVIAKVNAKANSKKDTSSVVQTPQSTVNTKDVAEKIYKVDEATLKKYVAYVYKNTLEREATEGELTEVYNRYVESNNNMFKTLQPIILGNESYELNGKDALYTNKICANAYKYIIGKDAPQNTLTSLKTLYGKTGDSNVIIKVVLNSSDFEQKINSFKDANTVEPPKRQLNYEIDKEKSRQLGDVNGDGTIDISDANIVLGYVSDLASGFDMSEFEFVKKYGDVNGDGRITPLDATWMLRYYCMRAVSLIADDAKIEELIKTFDEKFEIIDYDGAKTIVKKGEKRNEK